MTTRDPRRLATADLALQVLDAVPRPDDRAKFTGWIAWRAGLTGNEIWCHPAAYRALAYLARRGLVERVTWPAEYSGPGARYWRQTLAGAAWDGTVEQLARPVRERW